MKRGEQAERKNKKWKAAAVLGGVMEQNKEALIRRGHKYLSRNSSPFSHHSISILQFQIFGQMQTAREEHLLM